MMFSLRAVALQLQLLLPYQFLQSAGEDTSNHIFNYIRIVSDWLDQQAGIPTAAERERQRLAPIEEAFAKAGVWVGDFADFWEWQKRQYH
jgi:hypothetical protein